MEKVFKRSDGKKLEMLYPPYCEVCGNPIPDSFAHSNPIAAHATTIPTDPTRRSGSEHSGNTCI